MKKTVVGAGIIGALLYFAMGGLGIGIGPGGLVRTADDPEPPAEAERGEKGDKAKPAPKPCALRLDRRGLWRGDRSITVKQAVVRCRKAGRASVTVTGDAKQGDLDDLNRAFDEAGIEVLSNR